MICMYYMTETQQFSLLLGARGLSGLPHLTTLVLRNTRLKVRGGLKLKHLPRCVSAI